MRFAIGWNIECRMRIVGSSAMQIKWSSARSDNPRNAQIGNVEKYAQIFHVNLSELLRNGVQLLIATLHPEICAQHAIRRRSRKKTSRKYALLTQINCVRYGTL